MRHGGRLMAWGRVGRDTRRCGCTERRAAELTELRARVARAAAPGAYLRRWGGTSRVGGDANGDHGRGRDGSEVRGRHWGGEWAGDYGRQWAGDYGRQWAGDRHRSGSKRPRRRADGIAARHAELHARVVRRPAARASRGRAPRGGIRRGRRVPQPNRWRGRSDARHEPLPALLAEGEPVRIVASASAANHAVLWDITARSPVKLSTSADGFAAAGLQNADG
jgi:hypothetical protein